MRFLYRLHEKIMFATLYKTKWYFNFIKNEFHRWYYYSDLGNVQSQLHYRDTQISKNVFDLWNYQRVIFEMRPALIIEFGFRYGGTTRFFADYCKTINLNATILSVDIESLIAQEILDEHPNIEIMEMSSTDERVGKRIGELCASLGGGSKFVILDSCHETNHVLGEMEIIRPHMKQGDYLIVEDSNLNGHPIHPTRPGDGAWGAIEAYFKKNPDDYKHDYKREEFFGFTFAPNGYLIKT